ncbi:MAG: DUF4331 family protein [Clostridia bacterium]|nr:DUF4331 family protein [Deltaproteobacteria bacterium]
MKFTKHSWVANVTRGLLAASLLANSIGCSDDDDAPAQVEQPAKSYAQIEQLARPAIAEALLLSNAFLAGYNGAAPSFTGVDEATVNAVVGEAKTVLKAVYLGGCLLNGARGLSATAGVKPAGLTCHEVGPAIWTEGSLTGVTLTAASQTAAQAYADKVAGQFLPDTLRIDTSAASGYLTLCGDANSTPLLCGGRNINDDVIDVTYNYLINGAGTPKGAFDQVRALTGDGVNYSSNDAQNSGNVVLPDPSNPNQFHGAVSAVFPYSAAPY